MECMSRTPSYTTNENWPAKLALRRPILISHLRGLTLLCQLPPRLAGEVLGFRNQFDRLQDLRILFEQNARGVGNAELVVKDFVPDGPFDEILVVREVLFTELNSAFRNVLLELVDNC